MAVLLANVPAGSFDVTYRLAPVPIQEQAKTHRLASVPIHTRNYEGEVRPNPMTGQIWPRGDF
jgi:hypothetical protein